MIIVMFPYDRSNWPVDDVASIIQEIHWSTISLRQHMAARTGSYPGAREHEFLAMIATDLSLQQS